MTAIERLAEFVAKHPKREFARPHLDRGAEAFLDTLGCMILGRHAPVTQTALQACQPWGHGPAHLPGTAARLPIPWGALVGGAAAHSYDLDDYTLIANDHPSAVLVPAILAQASTQQEALTGLDLLDAYLIGLEVIFRAGEAVNMGHYNLGWHTTSTLDSLGATAAIARLSLLDPAQTAAALSLTTSMGSGYVSQFGTMAKPFHAGISAKAGVVACALAKSGATASAQVLDGPVSLTTLMAPEDITGFETALKGLGETWGLDRFGLGAKLYPSCGYTHRVIDGALAVRRALNAPDLDQIVSVELSLPDFHLAILPFGVPESPDQALFSAPWCAAVALATGQCTSADFTEEGLQRPDIVALTSRTKAVPRKPRDPNINLDPQDPDRVIVDMANGHRETALVDIWTGAPGRDLGAARMLTKFNENCATADIPPALSDPIAQACLALPQGKPVGLFFDALAQLDRV